MNHSESIAELSKALVKAQAEMSGAIKDSNNPFFKSKYADLGAVIKAIKEPFSNNGLAYTQFPYNNEKGIGVETMLIHESGEWLRSEYTLPMVKLDPQAAGSAITYARRYALQAMAGIPALDDDAESAMNRIQKAVGKQITREQAQVLHNLLAETEGDVSKFCKLFNCPDVDSMDASYYDKAVLLLNKKKEGTNA